MKTTPTHLLGTLTADGYCKSQTGTILLATSQPQAATTQPTRLATTDLAGKYALMRGERQDKVLYNAEIVEIVSPVTAGLLEALLHKGVIGMADLESQVAKALTPPEAAAPTKLCALVIGHKKGSPGAENLATRLSEFDFNDDLARRIEQKVSKMAVQRVYRRTYDTLPGDINALAPDVVVSLHCNAFNRQASGSETLYHQNSTKGKEVAAILQEQLVGHLGLPNRGIKAKGAEDRGGYLLRYTAAPCVIVEPFFIDNDDDLARAQADLEGLALAYARAIDALPAIV